MVLKMDKKQFETLEKKIGSTNAYNILFIIHKVRPAFYMDFASSTKEQNDKLMKKLKQYLKSVDNIDIHLLDHDFHEGDNYYVLKFLVYHKSHMKQVTDIKTNREDIKMGQVLGYSCPIDLDKLDIYKNKTVYSLKLVKKDNKMYRCQNDNSAIITIIKEDDPEYGVYDQLFAWVCPRDNDSDLLTLNNYAKKAMKAIQKLNLPVSVGMEKTYF
jgi:hypothetical protein